MSSGVLHADGWAVLVGRKLELVNDQLSCTPHDEQVAFQCQRFARIRALLPSCCGLRQRIRMELKDARSSMLCHLPDVSLIFARRLG